MTCYCSKDLCNNKNFRKKEFQKWRKVAKKQLDSKVTSFWLTLLDVSLNGFAGFVVIVFGIIIVRAVLSLKRNRRSEFEVVDPGMESQEVEEEEEEEDPLEENNDDDKKEL